MSFTLTGNGNPTDLIDALLPSSGSIQYQNPILVGDSQCAALFSGGKAAVPDAFIDFPDHGLVLSSGIATHLLDQDSESTTTNFGNPGDADLLPDNSTDTSFDACTLEFEFKCTTSTELGYLGIKYVFASDEYKEYSSSRFKDRFALLLNDEDIATLPSTTTGVSIDTVNQDVNPEYFVSNSPVNNPSAVVYPSFEADGFTLALTAFGKITEGWNTMKLGVTDVSDSAWDSWVILEQGGFDCFEDTPPPATLPPRPASTPAPTPAPTDQTPTVSGGDPHFSTFDKQFFSYHGQCDLVLTRSKSFASGLGLDIHIRTTRVDKPGMEYSYISATAVKIDHHILEVSEDGDIFINGKHHSTDLTADGIVFAGLFKLTKTLKGSAKRIIAYTLDLGEGKNVEIRVNKKSGMIFVDVTGTFADSEGLLGPEPEDHASPLLARDGKTDLAGHWNTYGEEWQVNDSDPKLFQDMDRPPQYPAGCLYEAEGQNSYHVRGSRRRRLMMGTVEVSLDEAEQACAHVNGGIKKTYCVDDVMATGDFDLAEDPFYTN